MHVITKSTSSLALLTVLLFGFQTNAVAEGFYFGGGIYQSEAEYEALDETDTTPAAFLGYNFIDSNIFMFSAELGYYDLGDYSDGDLNVDADAFTLAAVGTLPVGPFIELFAKVGAAQISGDANGKDIDGSETFYGAGIGFDFFDTIDIYVEYLEFDTEIDSRMIGAGIKFDFL